VQHNNFARELKLSFALFGHSDFKWKNTAAMASREGSRKKTK
jgi:hypothetical protein